MQKLRSSFTGFTRSLRGAVRDARGLPGRLRNIRLHTPGKSTTFSGQVADFFSSISAMLTLVFKRLRHNTGLSISAVIGVVAVMAMVVCVPVFSHAVSSKVLREQLEEKALTTKRSLFSLHYYYLDKRSASPMDVERSQAVTAYIRDRMSGALGLDTEKVILEVQSGNIGWLPMQPRGQASMSEPWMTMAIVANEDVRANSTIVDGAWPEVVTSGPVEVAILERTADEFFLNVGDRFQYQSIEIVITGIFQPENVLNEGGNDWFENPLTAYRDKLWVPLGTFDQYLDKLFSRSIFYVSWYVVMDTNDVRYDRAPDYARGLVQLDADLRRVLPDMQTDYSPLDALNSYRERADTLTNLFYAVSGPMIVLALLFISLTANIALQQYEQETATMRGRGTSWGQVASLNIIESLVIIIAGIPLALLVGWLAAVVMGQTLSFLRFTSRSDIHVTLQGIRWGWLALGAFLILLARFLPVTNLSRTSIVQVKQEQSRSSRKPLWQRFYLDFLLLLPGIYAYITMSGITKPLSFLSALAPTEGETFRDPLLFVAPSLFAMALCMIMLRLLPWLLRGLAKLVDNLPKVWAYLSIQQVARRPQDHASALLLIMISLSLAIYSASTAKTLDKWLHDSAYYEAGADLVVREYLIQTDTAAAFGQVSSGAGTRVDLSTEGYFDVNEHLKLPSVEHVTRVGRYQGTFSYGVGELPATFMGIDRLEFPDVAFYREDFAGQSLGSLMNALGADPNGVLVPRTLAEEVGLRIGDSLNVDIQVVDQNESLEMQIVGMFDYFPTIYPTAKPTMVINLESLFDDPDGVVNYDVWLDIRPDTDVELLLYQMRGIISPESGQVEVMGSPFQEVQEMMDQPERVGLFGVLNVGFLATGLMPGVGFVLYSYASLRRRFIQLGILQAIGISVKQLIAYLAMEQFLLMGIAILCGAGVGLLTSNMFVPFLQIGADRAAPVPPFEVLIGWAESGWLSFVFAIVLFLTMLGTIWYLSRMKVFQAVKMGEGA